MKKVSIFAAFGLVVAACALLYIFVLAPHDVAALDRYAVAGDAHADAAFLVGTAENPIRSELDRVLADVLMRPMDDGERLALASHGKELLKTMETAIDAIGEREAEVVRALDELESSPLAQSELTSVGHVVDLAHTRADLIADIRGLSYRANYHTAQIFERVIDEGGILTPAHIASLNEDLPQVEEQFDRRSNLYVELESVSADIRAALAALK